jgi:hypothetical protein
VNAAITIEADVIGTGEWVELERVVMKKGYEYYVFPTGYSAHWVRLRSSASQTVTAEFIYS